MVIALVGAFSWPSPCACEARAAGQSAPPPAEADVRTWLGHYYTAYAARDVDALSTMWVRGLPDPAIITDVVRDGGGRTLAFSNLRVSRLTWSGEAGTARAHVDVITTWRGRAGQSQATWIRAFAFARETGVWKVSRDVLAVEDFVRDLLQLPSSQERLDALDHDREMVSEDLIQHLGRGGSSRVARGDTAVGLLLLDLAVDVAERMNDRSRTAAALRSAAVFHRAARNLKTAIARYERARGISEALGDKQAMADASIGVAGVHYGSGDYPAADAGYRAALALLESIGNETAATSVLHSLGNVAYVQADYDVALEYYSRSLAAQERAEARAIVVHPSTTQGIARSLQAIGMVQKEQGDYPAALGSLNRARARFEASGDKAGLTTVHEAIGGVHREDGDLSQSLRHYLLALDVSQTITPGFVDHDQQGTLLAEVGEVYALGQRYPAALTYFEKSLSAFERAKSPDKAAVVLDGIAGVHFAQGAHEKALDYFHRSLALAEPSGNKKRMALTWARIGLVHAARGRPDDAMSAYDRSLSLAREANDRHYTMTATVLKAGGYAALARPHEALEWASAGIAQAESLHDLDGLIHARLVEGEAHRQERRYPSARTSLQMAIEDVERLRAAPASHGRFFADTLAPYMALVDVLMEEGNHDGAFVAVEKARQIRFDDIWGDGTAIWKGLGPDQRRVEQRLRLRRTSLQIQIARAKGGKIKGRQGALEADLTECTAALEAWEAATDARQPLLRILRGKSELVGLVDGARQVLDGRTALVAYAVTEARVYVFVVTLEPSTAGLRPVSSTHVPQGVRAETYRVVVALPELGKLVMRFRDAIEAKSSETDPSARELYDLLLKPAEAQLRGIRRLLVVPDGPLWMLPFQALRSASDRYLIEDRAVGYGASLTALVAQHNMSGERRAAAKPRERALIALGFAVPAEAASQRLALLRPGVSLETWAQPEDEVLTVVNALRPSAAGWTGLDATVERILAARSDARVLHLALPTVLSDASPRHSLLAFSASAGADDGLVHTSDVGGWVTTASTVVMSRTIGDVGFENTGAGLTAMSWAWFVAGASTTVVSQWVAAEGNADTLLSGLHRRLLSPAGPRPSDAFRQSILTTLAGKFRHPYYWAGFQVMGDER